MYIRSCQSEILLSTAYLIRYDQNLQQRSKRAQPVGFGIILESEKICQLQCSGVAKYMKRQIKLFSSTNKEHSRRKTHHRYNGEKNCRSRWIKTLNTRYPVNVRLITVIRIDNIYQRQLHGYLSDHS
jgi:hypothetical protein